jgi:hypothetical protein
MTEISVSNDNIISLRPFLDIHDEAEENRRIYFAEREAKLDEEIRLADDWDAYLRSRGFDDTSGLPPPSDGFRDIDLDDVEDVMDAFDRLVTAQREEHIDAVEALETIRGLLDLAQKKDEEVETHSAPEIRDLHPNEPLSLFEAVCLPELGGQLYVGDEGKPGRTAVKTLRAEIEAGRLLRVPPFNKNWRVSRQTIKEWLELRHTKDIEQRPEHAKTGTTVQDIRNRQKGTRSSLAATRAEKSMDAVEAARLRIQQGRDRLK